MPQNSFVALVDKLLLERGAQKGKYWCGTITSGEIIKELNKVDETSHHRNIKAMVEVHYPSTRSEPIGINGQGGWILHIRIRTK